MQKIAVVTGGSRGIGAASAVQLARRGWGVCIGYQVDDAAADEVAGRCRDVGATALAVRADVTSAADVGALFAAAADVGRVAALVNNAGIVDRRARVDEMSSERIQRMFAVNVLGAFLSAGEAVRRMSSRHGGAGGVIVNVSSGAARLGSPGEYVDYAASKGAIDTMTLGLAREVADEGIRVNAVRPGLINTDIHASGGRSDRIEELRDTVPMRRGGEPDEVAHLIAWLCSDESSYVTGALIDVTGGR